MTIATEPEQLSYNGDDSTVAFPVTWNYFAKSHVVATLRDSAGTEAPWILDTDYTLTDADLGSGTLTATTAPATGEKLVIDLSPPNTQDKDLPIGGAVPTPQIEAGLDLAAQRDAKLEAQLNRAILVPTSDSQVGGLEFPIDIVRASMLLAFDEVGAPTIADFIDNIFVNQEDEPVTDGTLYLWQKTSTGDLYHLKSSVWTIELTSAEIGVTIQAYDVDTLKADTADELTAGFSGEPYNAGTKTTGTFTPDQDNGNLQYAVNGGAHTLAPTTDNTTIIIQYTNNASAGAITTSGFTLVDGDTLTTTDGDDFFFYLTKVNGFSHLTVKALQ